MEMDVNRLSLVLGAAKYVKDEATAVEKVAKQQLEQAMAPGDRKVAMNAEGEPVASVSRTTFSTTTKMVVNDEAALVAWLKANHDGDGVEKVERVHEWKVNDLLREATETGVLPDGVDIVETTRGGYLQVRQSDEQRAALVHGRVGVMDLLNDYRGEIEK